MSDHYVALAWRCFAVFLASLTIGLAPSQAIAQTKIVELRADMANGTGPYGIPGNAWPWVDLVSVHDAKLTNFAGDPWPSSGWAGSGISTDPYRLQFDPLLETRVTIDGGTVPGLQSNTTYSYATWFQTGSDISSNQYLVEWTEIYGSPYPGMTMRVNGNSYEVYLGAIGWNTIAPVQTDTWYHALVAKEPGAVRVYLNGNLEATFANENTGDQVSEIVIGASTFQGAEVYGQWFSGAIAQATIFDYALDDAAALAEYQADFALYNVSGACCDGLDATCDNGVSEANCQGPLYTWTVDTLCTGVTCTVAPATTKLVELRADQADGAGPRTGADGPWVDLADSDDGTLTNFDGTTASGWQGNGSALDPHRLQYDGVNDNVLIPPQSVRGLQSATAYSCATWFKTGSNIADNQYLVEWTDDPIASPWPGMTFAVSGSQFRVYLNPWVNIAPVEMNTWYHALVAKEPGEVRIYLNGSLVATFGTPNIGDQFSEIVIGSSTFRGANNYGEWFTGAMGQVTIYAGALDASEALAEYEADKETYQPTLGACCDGATGTCDDNAEAGFPLADCQGLLDTFTEGAVCTGVTCDVASNTKLVEYRAELADGAGPRTGAETPWSDLTGNGHDGVLTNFAGNAFSGWAGTGAAGNPHFLRYDGTAEQRVAIPAGSVPELQNGNTTYTFEAWVNTGADVDRNQYIVEWFEFRNTPDPLLLGRAYPGMTIGIDSGELRVWSNPWETFGYTVAPDTWYHVVVSKQPGASDVYVNGQYVHTMARDNIGNQVWEIVLGAGNNGCTSPAGGGTCYGQEWEGGIGQATIWHGALDSTEVLAEFDADKAMYLPTGCCCDESDGTFVDGAVSADCQGPLLTWTAATTCAVAGCTAAPTGACCDGFDGNCIDEEFEVLCDGLQETWTEGVDCIDLVSPCERLPVPLVVDLKAGEADGSGPRTGADGPWVDLTGNGHVGALTNFDGDEFSGWQGDGTVVDPHRLLYDGIDDVVVIPAASVPELQNNEYYSFEGWIRTGSNVSTRQYIVEWFEFFGSTDPQSLGRAYPGMTVAVVGGGFEVYLNPWTAVPAVTVEPDTWYHVVIAKAPGEVSFYVNGQLFPMTIPRDNIGNQTFEIVIGAGTFQGEQSYSTFWAGDIAQASIYAGTLTADDVLAEYEADKRKYFAGPCTIDAVLVEPVATRKNRYISFALPPLALEEDLAIRVVAESIDGVAPAESIVRWVGSPFKAPDEYSSAPGLTFNAAGLGCDSVYSDWSSVDVVHVFGGEVVPNSVYAVETLSARCVGGETGAVINSDPLEITTLPFGDVVELFFDDSPAILQPDFKDIAAVVAKFLASPSSIPKYRAQLQPDVVFPDRPIDFKDIADAVSGFVYDPFPYNGPCTCPSTVTCGTSCAVSTECAAGFCIDGECTDWCGRCSSP